jgi:putative two-component system response regulator
MDGIKEIILIVDDEAGIRYLLKQKLSSLGYYCLEAENATRALEILADNTVGLVLLDMKMPGNTGLDILPKIRKLYPQTSVIMATAINEVSIVIECMKQGAYDYLTKPFDMTEIGISVNRALEKRRLELTLNDYHEHLQQKVAEQAKIIRESFLNSITSLAFALDAKDSYTNGHSERVAGISMIIGREINLSHELCEKIRIAGLIHDIGKIGIPESILNKSERLTESEFSIIKSHCEVGERILEPVVDDTDILKMVRHHHERFDGRGYPDGLSGKEIPVGARILALADSYDAMTTDRPYRKAMEPDEVIAEIERSKWSHFDPDIAEALIRMMISTPSL